MPSVIDLAGCARAHLDDYTDPHGGRAFASYDRLGHPNRPAPTDMLAEGPWVSCRFLLAASPGGVPAG